MVVVVVNAAKEESLVVVVVIVVGGGGEIAFQHPFGLMLACLFAWHSVVAFDPPMVRRRVVTSDCGQSLCQVLGSEMHLY